MYLHKENRELFHDAILLTSQKLEVSEDIVEKDYYVTLILKKLSSIEDVIQKNAKLIEGREALDFSALSSDEAQLVDKINAKYQELMIWTEDQKVDVSREIGRLTQVEKLAKGYVDDKELSSRIELYY